MLTKNANMPFLSLHTLAAARGDGLRPEFVKLFTRLAAGADATLSESARPPAGLVFKVREGPRNSRKPSDEKLSVGLVWSLPYSAS
ncbi:MAG TPA: hypothetical protein VGP86_09250 [Xanthobacteraceae bacterium]|jgi:hypothetical protein|nr:hypothetical protein [Xanthobacteraceae bacterium]